MDLEVFCPKSLWIVSYKIIDMSSGNFVFKAVNARNESLKSAIKGKTMKFKQ